MSGSVGVQVGRICPECGKEDSVPLIWGLPGIDAFRLAERGLVALGGCMLPGEDPVLACRSCGLHWGRDDDPTADEQALADLLGVGHHDVVRALGRGWRREAVGADDGLEWFVSGEPAQLALGVADSLFVLARPRAGWGEEPQEVYPPDGGRLGRDDVLWFPEVVAEAAEDIASRRRRSFRWCRTCRSAHAPETFVGGHGTCERCWSTVAHAGG
ncbi:hypothetical protein [Geodermatophilus sp. SYSU D00815]